jgi:hypothetical protein
MTDALSWPAQYNGSARQIDTFDERRGTNKKPNLADRNSRSTSWRMSDGMLP